MRNTINIIAFIAIVTTAIILIGCNKENNESSNIKDMSKFKKAIAGERYYCLDEKYQTREDRILQAKFIVDVVKSATYNLTTSDYEDVDDTISEAKKQAEKLFYHNRKTCYDYNLNVISCEIVDEEIRDKGDK
jgi:hypothetical protein